MKKSILAAAGLASLFLVSGCDQSAKNETAKDTPQEKMKARFIVSAEKFHTASKRLNKISEDMFRTIYPEEDDETYVHGIEGRRKALIDISASVIKQYQGMKLPPVQACEDIRVLREKLPKAIDESEILALINSPALQEALRTRHELALIREGVVSTLYRSNIDLVQAEAQLKNFEKHLEPFLKDMRPAPAQEKEATLTPLEDRLAPQRSRLKAVFGPLNEWQDSFIKALPQCENIMAMMKPYRDVPKKTP